MKQGKQTMAFPRQLALLALLAGACAPAARLPEAAGAPAPDPGAVEARVRRATTPAAPRQVAFTWELDEAGARIRGRGVVRMEAPERLRLDLFGPRGETYLAAALVGEEFRMPPAVAGRVALPSPALLWGALGVVRPPAAAQLAAAATVGDSATLRYSAGNGETIEFLAEGSLLRTVRRLGKSGALESITLAHTPEGAPRRAEYRDWGAYRTLVLSIESVTDAAAFPETTWLAPGAPR